VDVIGINSTFPGCDVELKVAEGQTKIECKSVEIGAITLERQAIPQESGSGHKQKGGMVVSFSFSVPLIELSGWLESNFGTDLDVSVEQAQQDLPLEEPTHGGSGKARKLKLGAPAAA
jgi:hypothetical protein